ncbi:hypothetical protein ACQ4WX_27195 [Streptomyces lasalocidi]
MWLARQLHAGAALAAGFVWTVLGVVEAESAAWAVLPFTWLDRGALPVLGTHANGVALETHSALAGASPWPPALLGALLAIPFLLLPRLSLSGTRTAKHRTTAERPTFSPGATAILKTVTEPAPRPAPAKPRLLGAVLGILRGTALTWLCPGAVALVALWLSWHDPETSIQLFTLLILPIGTLVLGLTVWSAAAQGWRAVASRATGTTGPALALTAVTVAIAVAVSLITALLYLTAGIPALPRLAPRAHQRDGRRDAHHAHPLAGDPYLAGRRGGRRDPRHRLRRARRRDLHAADAVAADPLLVGQLPGPAPDVGDASGEPRRPRPVHLWHHPRDPKGSGELMTTRMRARTPELEHPARDDGRAGPPAGPVRLLLPGGRRAHQMAGRDEEPAAHHRRPARRRLARDPLLGRRPLRHDPLQRFRHHLHRPRRQGLRPQQRRPRRTAPPQRRHDQEALLQDHVAPALLRHAGVQRLPRPAHEPDPDPAQDPVTTLAH